MKLRASIIILFIAFFMSSEASAQVDRRIGREQYKRDRKKTDNVDFVDQSTNFLAKELSLDDFQKAAVRSIIEDERQVITGLNTAKDITADERKDRAGKISKRIYTNIMPLLNKTQAEKYTKMEEEKKF
ncbi:hypothetical protein D3C87_352410 [compost metagenome]